MTRDPSVFAPGYSAHPYWWDTASFPEADTQRPESADVVVVGSGYTGLSAALQVLRGGRSVVVLDSDRLGWGCSTRNGGQVSTSLKGMPERLARRVGTERARAILAEGDNAFAFIKRFIAEEEIDCDFRLPGRFMGAHSARAFERQQAVAAKAAPGTYTVVAPDAVRQELATDFYRGGLVAHDIGSLNPARYHAALAAKVIAAGGRIVAPCKVLAVETGGARTQVRTTLGTVAAGKVLVATNGYTGGEFARLRRRVIPIASHVAATEPLDPALAGSLIPRSRVVTDTRDVVCYYRLSPDGTRLVYGGRVSIGESTPERTAPLLHAEITRIFPQLRDARLSHSWHGIVAFTFDMLPHMGVMDGVHYCMGYCGSGVSTATYFGMKAGLRLLGSADGRTALDALEFQKRYYYRERPWFMPPALAALKLKDRLGL